MKVIAFAASSSKQSINKKLVTYTTGLLTSSDIEILDLNDFELPLFSVDKEAELGQPGLAQDFLNKINNCDLLMISFAEHNGSYSAAYKNLFDWCSRIDTKVFQNKPLILLATSPGPGGGKNVLAAAEKSAPFFGGKLIGSLSVPSFNKNFDVERKCIINDEINEQLLIVVNSIE